MRVLNLNGQIVPEEAFLVSGFDRGFLYGDSLYEVVRTYRGVPFLLEAHLERLERSAKLADFEITQSKDVFEREIRRTISQFIQNSPPNTEAYCRLVVTRGVGKIGFGLDCIESGSQYFLIVQSIPQITEEKFEKGIRLGVSTRIRNHPQALDPAMKSGNYLNNLLAYLEVTKKGFDDALLANGRGFITEGTTFNIFYIKRGILVTPPLGVGILHGITRKIVFDAAKNLGIPLREIHFTKERLTQADEVFLTGTVKEVLPVVQVDQKKINGGRPGTLTRALFKEYQNYVESLISSS